MSTVSQITIGFLLSEEELSFKRHTLNEIRKSGLVYSIAHPQITGQDTEEYVLSFHRENQQDLLQLLDKLDVSYSGCHEVTLTHPRKVEDQKEREKIIKEMVARIGNLKIGMTISKKLPKS